MRRVVSILGLVVVTLLRGLWGLVQLWIILVVITYLVTSIQRPPAPEPPAASNITVVPRVEPRYVHVYSLPTQTPAPWKYGK